MSILRVSRLRDRKEITFTIPKITHRAKSRKIQSNFIIDLFLLQSSQRRVREEGIGSQVRRLGCCSDLKPAAYPSMHLVIKLILA